MAKWKKIEKRLPNDDRQVLALSGSCAYLASFREGQWWLTYTIKLGDVTRWMEVPGEPKDVAYWMNRLRKWWGRRKENAQRASDRWTGWTNRTAQLGKKPTFYRDRTGKIMSGMPENIPAPRGYEKIVCGSVQEAERYSGLQRQQERVEHRRQQAERGAIEGQFQTEIRSEMTTKMLNARNATNREFMRRALEMNAKRSDPTAYERESYLHAEAFEDKH
jgi:hypothetical protein